MVVRAPRFSAETEADRQGHDRSWRDFANATGDSGFDGALRQILAAQLGNSPYLALLPDARVSQTLRLMVRPADTKLTPGCCGRNLRADSQRRGRGGLHRKPRKRVRVGRARTELPNRRHSGRRAGAGSQKRGRLQGAGPNGKPVRDPGRRIASTRGKGAQSAGRGNHAFTGGLEVLQRSNEGLRDAGRWERKPSHS